MQRQVLKLRPVLTGKLVHSLDILTLHVLSLLEYVEKEAEDNPFIEFDEQEGEVRREKKRDFVAEEIESWLDMGSVDIGKYSTKGYREPPDIRETLQEHLLTDISVVLNDEFQLGIAKQIIYSLDEKGWLKEEPEEISKRIGVDRKSIYEVLNKIRGLEPSGIAASNLQECLLIQLERRGEKDTLAYRILKYAYEYLLSLDKVRLADKFVVSEKDIENALKEIHKLDPQPGRPYVGRPQYISPDAVIERTFHKDRADYIVYLPEFNVPRIHLSPTYRQLLEKPDTFKPEEKDYLMGKLQKAKNLLTAIEQRKDTIRRIAEYIRDREISFLSGEGPPDLITEKDVAQNIGVNVSTVSRAIKDKWIETPRGMFSFSYFFSHGRTAEYHWVLLLIEEMIKNEDKKHPISDLSISQRLKKSGFNVARTTVVKYRKTLGIPSSSKRRVVRA